LASAAEEDDFLIKGERRIKGQEGQKENVKSPFRAALINLEL